MGVPRKVVRRRIAAITAAVVMSVPASATAAPTQERSDDHSSEAALVDINVDVADDDAATIAGAIDDLTANVEAQLEQLEAAQQTVSDAVGKLAEADLALASTALEIEELTAQSDEVVVGAFINPPSFDAIEVLSEKSAADASLKQAVLDMQADENANALEELDDALNDQEDLKDVQQEAREAAEAARSDAENALADLNAALNQETEFVLLVRQQVDAGAAGGDPGRQAELAQKLAEIEEAAALAEALWAIDEAERRAAQQGQVICPVQGGGLNFTDTWGAARSGGRTHQGTDMMASDGTPTVAPVSGEVIHKESGLGGASWYIYGVDGDTYYGAHLSSYEQVGVGFVQAGSVIGYVGSSGNASADAPHLHFEHHPGGGSPVNPYGLLVRACPGASG